MRVETEILYKPDGKSVEIITEDYVKDLVDESYRKYKFIDKSFITFSLFNNTGELNRFSRDKNTVTIFYRADCSVEYCYSFKDNCINLKLSNISNFQHFVDNGILIYEKILISRINNEIKKSNNEILSLQLFGNVLFRDYEYIEELFREIDYGPNFSYAIKLRQSIYTIYAKYSPLLYVDYQRGSTNRLCVKFGDVEIIYYIEFDTSNSVLKITPFSVKGITDNHPIIKELCVKINKNN